MKNVSFCPSRCFFFLHRDRGLGNVVFLTALVGSCSLPCCLGSLGVILVELFIKPEVAGPELEFNHEQLVRSLQDFTTSVAADNLPVCGVLLGNMNRLLEEDPSLRSRPINSTTGNGCRMLERVREGLQCTKPAPSGRARQLCGACAENTASGGSRRESEGTRSSIRQGPQLEADPASEVDGHGVGMPVSANDMYPLQCGESAH